MAPTEFFDRKTQRAVPLWLIIVALVLVIARIVMLQREPESASKPDDLVQWVAIEEAASRANDSGKWIMYDFTAEWCGPCHQLEDAVFRNPQLAAMINARFVAVRVLDRQREEGTNSREVAELQQRYRVRGFPTLVFARADGDERGRMEGFGGADKFERIVENLR
jgi:thiol:disulfide interchange protein